MISLTAVAFGSLHTAAIIQTRFVPSACRATNDHDDISSLRYGYLDALNVAAVRSVTLAFLLARSLDRSRVSGFTCCHVLQLHRPTGTRSAFGLRPPSGPTCVQDWLTCSLQVRVQVLLHRNHKFYFVITEPQDNGNFEPFMCKSQSLSFVNYHNESSAPYGRRQRKRTGSLTASRSQTLDSIVPIQAFQYQTDLNSHSYSLAKTVWTSHRDCWTLATLPVRRLCSTRLMLFFKFK